MQLRLLFTLLFSAFLSAGFAQVTTVGIIGTATPGGWDADTDMQQDATNPDLWSIKLDLKQGEAKFRANDAWDVNWGAKDFPIGKGTQGGPNVGVPADGFYTVTFNAATGDYYFSVKSDIGIIGSAGAFGWDADVNMFQDKADTNQYTLTINLAKGDLKFRQNDAWAVNWGAVDFPSGVGTVNGPNIPIPITAKYAITFNKATGAYKFEEVAEYRTIGIIGTATPGGWDADTDLTRDGNNPNLWRGTVALTVGEAKFRANDEWRISWGDTLFPIGIGILNGPNIKIPAEGNYLISFNTETFEYKFFPIGDYKTVGIIGSATAGGWDNDTDMKQDPSDKSIWTLRAILKDGEAKFRSDDAWTINWGAGDFPKGVATQDGANIPVVAGEYRITFNSTTGDYNFEKLIVFSTIGIIGPATPVGNWDADVDMTKDGIDESFWYINSIEMKDGEAKFRAEDAWAVNWGLAQWPAGVGKQDGPNIPITAGTYKVTLNSATGEYGFSEPSSAFDLLKSNSIVIAPNPVKDVLNIEIKNESLRGEVRLVLFNMEGKQVMAQTLNIQDIARVDVSNLLPGNYLVHLTNGKYIVGKPIVVTK